MIPRRWIDNALNPALLLLPQKMDSPMARAMLICIALQESRLEYRHQCKPGPAHGYFQFEQGGGVREVLRQYASRGSILAVLDALDYTGASEEDCFAAIQHNDILATCFARLLLWTLPQALPARNAPNVAYSQYIQSWRPGKPHPDAWSGNWEISWELSDAAV